MNNGLHGFYRKPNESGKALRGLGLKDTSKAPKVTGSSLGSPGIGHMSSELSRRIPEVSIVDRAVPLTPYVKDLVWTGAVWAAISATQFSTSADLITWTAPVTLPNIGSANVWSSMSWNGSQFVAVSASVPDFGDGFIYTAYSSTGASWSLGTSFNIGGVFATNLMALKPVWTGAAWLFTGIGFTGVVRSTDGINWSRLLTTSLTYGDSSGNLVSNGSGIAVLSLPIVTMGAMWTNDHGVTWTMIRLSTGFMSYDPIRAKFIAFQQGSNHMALSDDALTWSRCPATDTGSIASIASINNYYVYVVDVNKPIVISKHDDDIGFLNPNPAYINFTSSLYTANMYYQAVAGDNKVVLITGFGTPGYSSFVPTAYVGEVIINPSEVQRTSASNVFDIYYKT